MLKYVRPLALVLVATPAAAFHDGDQIYGIVDQQIRTVIPTNALTHPPRFSMNRIPPNHPFPEQMLRDVGWDWFSLDPNQWGIQHVREAFLSSPYADPALRVRDNGGNFFFTPTATFPTYHLTGTRRHKHFQFTTTDLTGGRELQFQYQYVNAFGVDGNAVQDSPVYTLIFVTSGDLARTVSGHLVLGDWSGPMPSEVTFEYREPGETLPIRTETIAVQPDGTFFGPITVGRHDLSVRFASFLRRTVPYNSRDHDITDLTLTLVNGDVTGDNVVGVADFLALRAAFGANPASPNWNPRADLNGDGVVNLADFLALRRNFGATGDL